MREKILLIDYMNFVYKGKISFKTKDDQKEDNVIVYNFFRNLRAVIEQFQPTKCFFALEGNPRFRKKLLPSYKANRIVKNASQQKDKESFDRQRDTITALLRFLPVKTFRAEEYEADDVLWTLSGNLANEEVIVVSSDSDLIQIIQKYPRAKLYNPIKKSFIDIPGFSYLVFKVIAGDKKTDNIPGILSEEKAKKIASSPKLLTDFLSSEENKSLFSLNRKLIELQEVHIDDLVIEDNSFDPEQLRTEFIKLELPSLLKDEYWERFTSTFKALS